MIKTIIVMYLICACTSSFLWKGTVELIKEELKDKKDLESCARYDALNNKFVFYSLVVILSLIWIILIPTAIKGKITKK